MLVVRMRQDLVSQGVSIPANNTEDFYSSKDVENMEFINCVDELGFKDRYGKYYAMKTEYGKIVHLYAVDCDYIE